MLKKHQHETLLQLLYISHVQSRDESLRRSVKRPPQRWQREHPKK